MSIIKQPKTWCCDFCYIETTNGPICEVCEITQQMGVQS